MTDVDPVPNGVVESPPSEKAGIFGHLSACAPHWREFNENVDRRPEFSEEQWSARYLDIEKRVLACPDCAGAALLRLDLVGDRVGRRPEELTELDYDLLHFLVRERQQALLRDRRQ